jgi:hypothetical protein
VDNTYNLIDTICKVVSFFVGVVVDLNVALECLTFNKPGEIRRALQHVHIILRTFGTEERGANPNILRCHSFKNNCATFNMPFVLPFQAKKTCMKLMLSSIQRKPLELLIAMSLVVSSTFYILD